jgi:uncharacterized glyoxalase superfamily protein PhnB
MRNTLPAIQVILIIFVVAIAGCKERKETDIKKENVMYRKLTTNMMVEDVSRTVDFYSEVLGFELVIGVPENSQEIVTTMQKGQALGFAIMKCGNIDMMFQTKQSLAKEVPEFSSMDIGGSLTFYIEVQDVRGLYAKLKDKVTIVKDMQTTFYGMQEFYIRDCNGYILTFAERIQEQSS